VLTTRNVHFPQKWKTHVSLFEDVDLDPPDILINSCSSKHNPLRLRILKANFFAGYLAFDSVASDSVLQVNI